MYMFNLLSISLKDVSKTLSLVIVFIFSTQISFANQDLDSFVYNVDKSSRISVKSTNNLVEYIDEYSGISVLDFTGNYNKDINGQNNIEARIDVAQVLYSNVPDTYDFIVVFTTFPIESGEALAFASVIENDVTGIGRDIFDNSDQFGSEKLQLMVDMKNINNWAFDPSNPEFEQTSSTLMHEIMHRWGISVKFIDANSQISNDLLGSGGAHWNYFLNSNASIMYGSLWEDLNNGSFRTIQTRSSLSPLDLYLSGFLAANSVPDFFLIENGTPGANTDYPPGIGTLTQGDRLNVSINDIIVAEGARIPSAADSQHSFNIKFVLLKQTGEIVADNTIGKLNVLQKEIKKRFFAETNGIGNINYSANNQDYVISSPEPLPFTDSSINFNLTDTLNFILQNNDDNHWQDRTATEVRDTVSVIKAFQVLVDEYPEVQNVLSESILWLNNHAPINNDERAWMLVSSVLNNDVKQQIITTILANELSTGGWGLNDTSSASNYDTALVLWGLYTALGDDFSISPMTAQYVTNNINQDNGFSFVEGGKSSFISTSMLLKSALNIGFTQQNIDDLTAFILTRQLPDGSFGEDVGSAYETAVAINLLVALSDDSYQAQIDLSKSALEKLLSLDGSMQGSIYSTALAISIFNTNTQANLYFSQVNLSNNNIIAGEQILVNLEIKNSGVIDANNIDVSIYKDVVDVNNEVAHVILDLLTPNQISTIALPIDTTGFNLNTELIAVIDTNNNIIENNENDNSFILSLTVQQPSSAYELAYNSGLFVTSPVSFDILPFTLNASASVANLSTQNTDNVIVALSKIEANGEYTLLDSQEFNIPALGNQEFNFSTEITQAAIDLPLILSIDPNNTIVERNENNNTYTFSIRKIQSIDIKITNEDVILPIGPVIGETQNITFSFINSGTVLSSGFDVRVYSEINSDIKLIHQSHVNELSGGEQISRNITWLPIELGTHYLKFVLDEANELAEVDETNNEVIVPIQVEANSLTNLYITDNDITMSPDPGLEGQDLQFSINVHNNSNLASGGFEINLSKKNTTGIPNTLLGTQNIANVDANDSLIVNFNLIETNLQGENYLIFSLDSNNSIEEFSETDNLVIKQYRIFSKADALVSAGSFQFTPSIPVQGELLSVEVNISNSGEQSLEQLEASLYYDNSQQSSPVLVETQTIPLLMGGETQTNLFTFVLPNNNQIDTFTVKLDEAGNINEGSETNNEASVLIGTQDQTLYVTQRYFSPNGDGIKDQTSIVFNTETVGNYSIEIVDDRNKLIKLFNSQLFENTTYGDVIWDGRNNKGILARDGDFRVNLLDQNLSVLKTRLVTLDTNRSSLFKSIIENNGYNTELNIIESYNPESAKLSHDGKYLYITDYIDKQGQNHQGIFALKADGSTIDPVVPETFFDNANYITFALLDNGNILMTFQQNGSFNMYMKNMATGDNDLINDYPEYIGSAQEIYAYTSEFAIVKGGDGNYLKIYFDVLMPSEGTGLYDSKIEHVLNNGLIISQEISGEGPDEFGGQYNISFISFDFTVFPQQIASMISDDEYISMVRKGNVSIDGRNFVFRKGESIQIYQTENNNLITTFSKYVGINDNYGFNSHNELYVLNQDDQAISIYNELGSTVTKTGASLLIEDFDLYLVDIQEVEVPLQNGYSFTANISDMLDSTLRQKVISYTDYSDEKELVLLLNPV